jgi:hypothetical protein
MKRKIIATLLLLSGQAMSFDAHEWGTFTSVVGSDGKLIEGLHHEEEVLPIFVYDLSKVEDIVGSTNTSASLVGVPPRPPMTRGFFPESMNQMPIPTFTERITQKMETPVIYFYTKKEIDVNVRVDFPNGVISQWYPKISKVNPSVEAKNGYATWDVKVLKDKKGLLPLTSGNSIWNPSREVESNLVKVNEEQEKLIFYRGLGDFETKLEIKEIDGRLSLTNNSNQDIHGITILNHRSENNNLLGHIEILKANSTTKFLTHGKTMVMKNIGNYDEYLKAAKSVLVKDLILSGLFEDESKAMVNTWEGGYFQTKGLRVLYVLPREWTEEILPLKFNPAPENLVRTLVGRVEVLTKADELKILEFVKTDIKENKVSIFDVNGRLMDGLGHFPEPKLRRALELDISNDLKLKVKKLIRTMNQGFLN